MRRGLFLLSTLLGLAATAQAAPRRKPKPVPPRAAELYAVNTRETFFLRPDARGHIGKRELHGFNRFLRCHHTGRTHAMAPRLAELLYATERHFDFKRIVVVAGYRAPRIAREKGNPRSPHKRGVACDFRVDGVANTELRDFVRGFAKVGVGYYPNSGFVHLDVRDKQSAFWIDYSGPGERARYSADPGGDLAGERMGHDAGEPLDDDGDVDIESAARASAAPLPSPPATKPATPPPSLPTRPAAPFGPADERPFGPADERPFGPEWPPPPSATAPPPSATAPPPSTTSSVPLPLPPPADPLE